MNILPAEWAPQSGIMLTWPHAHSDWSPWLDAVEKVYCEIAYHVCRHEKLLVSCWDETHKNHIDRILGNRDCDPEQFQLHIVQSNDTWARDHGPITVYKNNQPILLDFIFNGWGKKYEARLDNLITRKLHNLNAFGTNELNSPELVLEGGSIESDGEGTLLTTSNCLLSPKRNPALSQQQIEQQLAELFGVERFLWLENGHLIGDDTDSHIDTLARFCNSHTICHVSCEDSKDPHFKALNLMTEELAAFRTSSGKPYDLVDLPLPRAIYNEEGIRLPASYANFLIINQAVLVPVYDDPENDDIALEKLSKCFPDREVVAINCIPLIHQFGSLHCITMQLPRGVI